MSHTNSQTSAIFPYSHSKPHILVIFPTLSKDSYCNSPLKALKLECPVQIPKRLLIFCYVPLTPYYLAYFHLLSKEIVLKLLLTGRILVCLFKILECLLNSQTFRKPEEKCKWMLNYLIVFSMNGISLCFT